MVRTPVSFDIKGEKPVNIKYYKSYCLLMQIAPIKRR